MSGSPTIRAKLAATAHDFWRARQPRERHILGIGAVIFLLLLIWLSLIAPAIEGRSRWQRTLPTLHSQLAQMHAMASEIVASPSGAMVARGSVRRRMLARSAGPSRRLMPDAIAPRRSAARYQIA